MTTQPPSPPDTIWALDLLWVGLLALYAFAGYPITPFHGDESMQIYMSNDYATLVQDGDPARLRYDAGRPAEEQLLQQLRIINGTLNKYTVGLAWDAAGFTRDDLNAPWYWDETYDFNVAGGFHPGADLLLAARVPSALFLSGAVVVFFFVGKAFAGRPAAYMLVAYLALSPAVLVNGRRAMMEGSLLFGAGLTLLAGLWLVRAEGRRFWWAVPLLGLGAGVAVAAKHTNVVAVVGIFLGCILYALVNRRLGMLGGLVVAGVLSLGVFFTLNPAYWGNPVATAQAVVAERTGLLGGQVDRFGGYAGPIDQLAGFYTQVFDGAPIYHEVATFDAPMREQVPAYEGTPSAGIYLPGVGVVTLAAFVLGTLILVGIVPLPDIVPGARWVVGTYAVVTAVFLLVAVPIAWQRYYLPMFPVVGLVAPLGVIWVVRLYVGNAAAESPEFRKGSARLRRR